MPKSTKPHNVEEVGIITLGKYTFVSKFELPTRLFPERLTAPEK